MISQTSQVKTRLDHLFQHLEEWKTNFLREVDAGLITDEVVSKAKVSQVVMEVKGGRKVGSQGGHGVLFVISLPSKACCC